MIDWDRVETLRAEIGAADFEDVVRLFLDEVDEVIARLESRPDPNRYEDDLHFLKGSAMNLGFAAFGAVCEQGERLSASGRAAAVEIGAVIATYRASRQSFLQSRQSLRVSA